MAAPTRPPGFPLDGHVPQDALERTIAKAGAGGPLSFAGAQELKRVQVFQANIKLQSGKVIQMIIPADVTDADVLDLIMEIAKNISSTARQVTAQSLLAVPAGPLADRS